MAEMTVCSFCTPVDRHIESCVYGTPDKPWKSDGLCLSLRHGKYMGRMGGMHVECGRYGPPTSLGSESMAKITGRGMVKDARSQNSTVWKDCRAGVQYSKMVQLNDEKDPAAERIYVRKCG